MLMRFSAGSDTVSNHDHLSEFRTQWRTEDCLVLGNLRAGYAALPRLPSKGARRD